jgi:hypothetical protein
MREGSTMSASDEWAEWHLTPRGWEPGDVKLDVVGVEKGPLPADRVLTCCYNEHMGSAFSKLRKSVSEKWRSEDTTAVSALLRKFGNCPESLF